MQAEETSQQRRTDGRTGVHNKRNKLFWIHQQVIIRAATATAVPIVRPAARAATLVEVVLVISGAEMLGEAVVIVVDVEGEGTGVLVDMSAPDVRLPMELLVPISGISSNSAISPKSVISGPAKKTNADNRHHWEQVVNESHKPALAIDNIAQSTGIGHEEHKSEGCSESNHHHCGDSDTNGL